MAARAAGRGRRLAPTRPVRGAGADRRRVACGPPGPAARARSRCSAISAMPTTAFRSASSTGTRRTHSASPKWRCAGRCWSCGLATLVLFPLYVAPRLSRATALVFAALLAISPLLVVYSGWRGLTRSRCCWAGSRTPPTSDFTAVPARRRIAGAVYAHRRGARDLAARDRRAFRAGAAAVGIRSRCADCRASTDAPHCCAGSTLAARDRGRRGVAACCRRCSRIRNR